MASAAASSSASSGRRASPGRSTGAQRSRSPGRSALALIESDDESDSELHTAEPGDHVDEQDWPEEYDKLKRRLKRLRLRFYEGRKQEFERQDSVKDQWHIPRRWIEKEAREIRKKLHRLRDTTAQFHLARRNPAQPRWLEARKWELDYHSRSNATKRFNSVPEIHDDKWVTGEAQEEKARAKGKHAPVLGKKIRIEILELERIVEELRQVQFISTTESTELSRLSTEDAVPPRPLQSKKQDAAERKARTPRVTQLKDTIFTYVKFAMLPELRALLAELTVEQSHALVNVARGEGMNTPLHEATILGHMNILRELLAHGSQVDPRNKYGWTPLHIAVGVKQKDVGTSEGSVPRHDCIRCLIENGADVNAVIGMGFTTEVATLASPLHVAANVGNEFGIRTLLEAGAHTDLYDENGRNALAIAARADQPECVQLLTEGGCKLLRQDYWLVTPEMEIQAMRERFGADPLPQIDNATPELLRNLGACLGDLTGREVTPRTNPASHFIVNEDQTTKLQVRKFFMVDSPERLGGVYRALIMAQSAEPPLPRPALYEYIGAKTPLVIDWKARFPLLVPENPTHARQSVIQCVQEHLREALPAAKLDCFIYTKDSCYRQYYPYVIIPRQNLYLLHLWVMERLEQELRGCGASWSMRRNFSFLSTIYTPDVWKDPRLESEDLGADAGAETSYGYLGHYDEFGLRIHDRAPRMLRQRWLTSLRRDDVPIKSCAELSKPMRDFMKVLHRNRHKRPAYKLTI